MLIHRVSFLAAALVETAVEKDFFSAVRSNQVLAARYCSGCAMKGDGHNG
jgi:hypothetical protein